MKGLQKYQIYIKSGLMAPLEKKNRSKLACNRCRDSKIRCHNMGKSEPCVRCQKLSFACSYTPTTAQQRHKPSSPRNKTAEQAKTNTPDTFTTSRWASSCTLPSKELILVLVDIFFENQYRGIFPFIHKPSFCAFLNSDKFAPETYLLEYESIVLESDELERSKIPDPILILAILALCCRFYPLLSPAPDSSPTGHTDSLYELLGMSPSDASKYYGEQARHLLKEVFDQPTIQRIQGLVLLSSHEWGEGNSARSFVYVGIAARMALILGLGVENKLDRSSPLDNEAIIYRESKRRTIWSIYMMDRCNSSGRNRSPAIKVNDIQVDLPSEERSFLFGLPGTEIKYAEMIERINASDKYVIQQMPVCNFTILVFEVWSKVARWVGELDGKLIRTRRLESDRTYESLMKELEKIHRNLPKHLIFSDANLDAHILHLNGAHFGYFHSLLLLCDIFLLRESFFRGQPSLPLGSFKLAIFKMKRLLEDLTLLVSSLRQKKMMVMAPFTAFEVFTASITSLFFYAYPSESFRKQFSEEDEKTNSMVDQEIQQLKTEFKQMSYRNMEMLSEWADSWELARRWYRSIEKLGRVFETSLSENTSVLENDSIRHEIQDYGDGKVAEILIKDEPGPAGVQKALMARKIEKENNGHELDTSEREDDYYIELIPSPILDIFCSGNSGFFPKFDLEWDQIDFVETNQK